MDEPICTGCETGWTPAHSAQLRERAEGSVLTADGMTQALALYVEVRNTKGRSQGRG
jgi:hypothetical protein